MFTDKNGVELKIGDHIIPDDGLELLIIEEKYIDDLEENCLMATQVINPDLFSILPQDNLSLRWSKVNDTSESVSILQQSVDPVIISEESYIFPESPNVKPYENNDEADKEFRERTKINGE